jgi:hypothetical protein
MTVHTKSDEKTHRSLGLGKSLPALRPVIRSGRTGCLMSKLELARENTTPFGEDFYWEHSLTSVSDVLLATPNSSDSVRPATRRNRYANNINSINSPNCVYVG